MFKVLKYGRYIIFQKDRTLLKLLARSYKWVYFSLGLPLKPNFSEPNYTIFFIFLEWGSGSKYQYSVKSIELPIFFFI